MANKLREMLNELKQVRFLYPLTGAPQLQLGLSPTHRSYARMSTLSNDTFRVAAVSLPLSVASGLSMELLRGGADGTGSSGGGEGWRISGRSLANPAAASASLSPPAEFSTAFVVIAISSMLGQIDQGWMSRGQPTTTTRPVTQSCCNVAARRTRQPSNYDIGKCSVLSHGIRTAFLSPEHLKPRQAFASPFGECWKIP